MIRQSILLSAARFISILAQAILTVQFARASTLNDFGQYTFWFAVISLSASFFDIGFSVAIPRAIGGGKIAHSLLLMRLQQKMNNIALLVIGGLVALFLILNKDVVWICALLFAVFTEFRIETALTYFYGHKRIWPAIANVFVRRLVAVTVWAAVENNLSPIYAMVLSLSVSTLTGLVLYKIQTRDLNLNQVSVGSTKVLFRELLGIVPVQYLGSSRNLDIPILQFFCGSQWVALYGAGLRLSSPISMLYQSSSTLLLPRTVGVALKDVRRILRASISLAISLTCVLLILFVPGQMLVIFVLGPNFEESANIVWVVICLSPIIASSQTATALALSSMRESLARKASTVFAAVVIAGCAIGAITAQAIGVLVAVSIASLSKFVILARGLLKTND